MTSAALPLASREGGDVSAMRKCGAKRLIGGDQRLPAAGFGRRGGQADVTGGTDDLVTKSQASKTKAARSRSAPQFFPECNRSIDDGHLVVEDGINDEDQRISITPCGHGCAGHAERNF